MNILYVYAHPNPASLNAKLMQHAASALTEQGQNIEISDLYAARFKAVADWDDFKTGGAAGKSQYFLAQQDAFNHDGLSLDIQTEMKKIANADHIILQFPLWWFSAPAMLKGWLDRVFVKGFAYDAGKVFEQGLLRGKTASLVVTTQSPETAYQEDGQHQATIDAFLHSIHHTLRFAGIKTLPPHVIYSAFNLEKERTDATLLGYTSYLKAIEKSRGNNTAK